MTSRISPYLLTERELMSCSILFLGIVRIRSVFIGEGPIALTVMPNSANSFPRI